MEQVLPILPLTKKYLDLSINEYNNIFEEKNIGGSINDIILYQKELNSNNILRKGGNLWTFLGNIAKKALPFISQYILPEAVNFGQNLVQKQAENNSKITKEDIKDLSKKSVKNIIRKVASGKKKLKNKSEKKIKSKRRRKPKIKVNNKIIKKYKKNKGLNIKKYKKIKI